MEDSNYWDNSQYESCQYATRLLDKLRKMNEEVNRPIDIDEVRKAIYYAKKYHGSQMRQSPVSLIIPNRGGIYDL